MRVNLPSGARMGTGLAIGAAAVLLAPIVVPVASGILKSLAKAGVKGGMILYEKGRELAEESRETLEDIAAEARSELQEQSGAEEKPAKSKKAIEAKK
ncbi:MAG: DUF5132 domain-containing protein [Desulfobacteraceae bacterium]